MRKGFRPSLEPPTSRRVNLDGRRPLFCVVMTTAVILLIAAIFGVSAVSLHQHRFGQNNLAFHAGDQMSLFTVSGDLTAVFCDEYQITLMEQDKAFLLSHRAKINQSLISTSSFDLHHEPSRRYTFLEVYLLPGSTLEVGACRENGSLAENIHVLLIEGSSNFNKWRLNPHCSNCVLHRVTVLPSKICGQDGSDTNHKKETFIPEPEIIMNVTLTQTDRYIFVVHYEQGQRQSMGDNNENEDLNRGKSGVIVSGIFNRTRYDTADAKKHCRGKGACEFELDWGTSPDVVVDFANPKGKVGERGQERNIITKCKIRYGFWVLVFLGAPLVLGIPVAGAFSWFLCRRSRQPSMKRLSRQAEKRVMANEIVSTRDDSGLVCNEVIADEGDGSMTIQDD